MDIWKTASFKITELSHRLHNTADISLLRAQQDGKWFMLTLRSEHLFLQHYL